MPDPPSGFHAHDGWYFERQQDGTVHVKLITWDSRSIVEETLFDQDTWASILAAVCARGETAETFIAAQEFHNG